MDNSRTKTTVFSHSLTLLLAFFTFVALLITPSNRLFKEMLYQAVLLESKELNTIILDAGHGGEDCGAIGNDNIYEKDLNLAYANKLAEYLISSGYRVVMTRSEDKLMYK